MAAEPAVIPYWYKLILYWIKEKGRTGLTIPFIIGARTLIDNQFAIGPNSVAQLLTDIKESDVDRTLRLFHCPNILEYVIGLQSPASSEYGQQIKNTQTNKTTLIAGISTEMLGKDFSSIVNSLELRYASILKEGRFAKNINAWIPFTKNNLAFIEKVFKG